MGIGNGPEFADATDGTEVDEAGQGLAKAFIADVETGAEVGTSERSIVTHRPVTCSLRLAATGTPVPGGHDGRRIEDGGRSAVLAAVDGVRGSGSARGLRTVGAEPGELRA
jgi:hypothetical protein